MQRTITIIAVLLLATANAFAFTVTYGWEDGNTILGRYGGIFDYNVTSPDPVRSGLRSLKLVDNSGTDTPQAYVAWIKGLTVGDVVTASFWVYDTTPGTSPSARIWAHWNNNPNDVNGFNGSAGGNNTYSGSQPWSNLSWSWTVPSGNSGIVIEVRTYSVYPDTVWVDDLVVTVPDRAGITIVTPGGTTVVPEPGSLLALATAIIGFAGYVGRRK